LQALAADWRETSKPPANPLQRTRPESRRPGPPATSGCMKLLLRNSHDHFLVMKNLFLIQKDFLLIREDLVERMLVLFDRALIAKDRLLIFQNRRLIVEDGFLIRYYFLVCHIVLS
jgi:hypothetical protein